MKLKEATLQNMLATNDLGLMPKESREKSDSISLYRWIRDTDYPLVELIQLGWKASTITDTNLKEIEKYSNHKESEFRF